MDQFQTPNFKMNQKQALIGLVIIFLAISISAGWFLIKYLEIPLPEVPLPSIFPTEKVEGITTFSSEEDFQEYLAKSKGLEEYIGAGAIGLERATIEITSPLAYQEAKGAEPTLRVSETNVQVPGIDEPDILKTDGKNVYFSPGRSWPIWRPVPLMEEKTIYPPYYKEPKIKIIKAFPPKELNLESEIEETGDLLLYDNILMIFSYNKVQGFDVKDPKNVSKKWEANLEDDTYIVTSRLYNEKVYLVLKQRINEFSPCPIRPLKVEGKDIEIKCQEIYHPVVPVSIDTTFIAMVLDPKTGKIEKKVSFVGSSSQSVVYMSENALYITYPYYESFFKVFADFLEEECRSLFPDWIFSKIAKLRDYDLSQEAKLLELQLILEKYQRSLDQDERLKLENEIRNKAEDYFKAHMRELEKTGIVKIDVKDLKILKKGDIPGRLLNQFSLDEYQGYLRVATTVGQRFLPFGFGGRSETSNDIYVLDENLKIVGKIQDLGVGERIYSARFIQDKGYLVTFRQIDPFFVLDLSDPENPQLKGELKIPGYSSYLHPITDDKILGIGKENWQIKISLFDVQNPENPKELDKYILDETFSDILSTHHAFLLDKKHQIFFLPGAKGGYIFSYKNDKLELKKAIAETGARRALYIDDYLYIVSDKGISVIDENTWERVEEFEF